MSDAPYPGRRALLCALAFLLALPALAGDAEPAPNFFAKTMDGQKFTNASVKGKVVLFQFWTTWCTVCQSEERMLDALAKEFEPQGLIVLAIDVGESKKTVKRYLQDRPRAVKIVLNDDTNLAAQYAANQYPIYVVIGREGNIAAQQRGGGGEGALRDLLARAGLGVDEEE
jgi:thiol-disulfide isomerase/thioredoxin